MQDIGSSVEVGVENNSTCLADEGRALPLTFFEASTCGAGLARIRSPDELNCDTKLLAFIDKELLQLTERPVGKEPVLLMPMHCFPDAFEVLQYDYPIQSCGVEK